MAETRAERDNEGLAVVEVVTEPHPEVVNENVGDEVPDVVVDSDDEPDDEITLVSVIFAVLDTELDPEVEKVFTEVPVYVFTADWEGEPLTDEVIVKTLDAERVT